MEAQDQKTEMLVAQRDFQEKHTCQQSQKVRNVTKAEMERGNGRPWGLVGQYPGLT